LARDRCCTQGCAARRACIYREENPNGAETIRLVSAREADPRERRIYLEQPPYSAPKRSASDGVARRQKRADVSQIDYSDIPALTEKQLTQFRRPPKKLAAVRLDADVFEWLQQYGAGYSTRINNVLRVVMSQGR